VKRPLASVVFLAICLASASSQSIKPLSPATGATRCVFNTIDAYVSLGTTGCIIGNYLFYSVQYSYVATGGTFLPTVYVQRVLNSQAIRAGARLTGLSLEANWLVLSDQSYTFTLSVSVMALPPATGIPGGLLGYAGSPFPSSFVPSNQAGASSYTYSDSNGTIINGSNLFNDLNCNSCVGAGGGAEFFNANPPQSMTLTYTEVFSASNGGLGLENEQFIGAQVTKSKGALTQNDLKLSTAVHRP
jgi:hypothetical protein